jgi:hypothetical protein
MRDPIQNIGRYYILLHKNRENLFVKGFSLFFKTDGMQFAQDLLLRLLFP